MAFLQPFSARKIAAEINRIVLIWDTATPDEKANGHFINPDEPLVISAETYEFIDDDDDQHNYYHVKSIGGGGDVDEDGTDVGHAGFNLSTMEIEQPKFFYNGRRA